MVKKNIMILMKRRIYDIPEKLCEEILEGEYEPETRICIVSDEKTSKLERMKDSLGYAWKGMTESLSASTVVGVSISPVTTAVATGVDALSKGIERYSKCVHLEDETVELIKNAEDYDEDSLDEMLWEKENEYKEKCGPEDKLWKNVRRKL